MALPGTPGQRISDLCNGNHITQKELAEKIGVSASQLSRIVSGETRTVSSDILIGVAKEFKVSTDYILGLSTVSVRKSYDISELGLSEGAVRGLVTGAVDVQILNRLLEHRNFPIDAALAQRPADFAAFLRLMEAAGFKAQRRGSSLSFLAPGQEKATRCRKKTLGDDYTPEAIQERIEGRRVVSSSRSKAPAKPARKVNLLIDIQSKLQAGKGAGYAQWAKVFNLKQMAQTISFLEENGLLEYDALAARAAEGTARFNELSGTIKRTEGRMAEIAALQKQIVNYSKTRDVYAAYRKAGYSKKFLAAHETEILLHKAAKAAFDKLCLQKLPTYKTLQAEYAGLLAEKKKAYAEYAAAKKEMQAVLTAKANVDRLLGAPPERPEQEKEQAQR